MRQLLWISGLALLASCSSRDDTAFHRPTNPNVISAYFIDELDSSGKPVQLVLSNQILRIYHCLKNESDHDVILYDLENSIMPEIEGFGMAAQGGGSAEPRIILAPKQSVCRWVELDQRQGGKDYNFSVRVNLEIATGLGGNFYGNTTNSTIRFRVGYWRALFSGRRTRSKAPVLTTPWINISVRAD